MINKAWFVRFEPNFGANGKTILYQLQSGQLLELGKIYYDFIRLWPEKDRIVACFQVDYNLGEQAEEVSQIIQDKLRALGVVIDES